MKLSAVFIICIAALCGAQNLGDLPQCAQACVGNSLSTTGCNTLDLNCICKSSGWISGLSCCISKQCSTADQQATITFADQLCAASGITLPSTASCASSSGGTSATSGLSSGSSAIVAGTTTGASGTSSIPGSTGTTATASGASISSSVSSASVSVSSTASSASVASSASSAASVASATQTAGAMSNFVRPGLNAAGAAVAALALL